jgi:hypothetical protein
MTVNDRVECQRGMNTIILAESDTNGRKIAVQSPKEWRTMFANDSVECRRGMTGTSSAMLASAPGMPRSSAKSAAATTFERGRC